MDDIKIILQLEKNADEMLKLTTQVIDKGAGMKQQLTEFLNSRNFKDAKTLSQSKEKILGVFSDDTQGLKIGRGLQTEQILTNHKEEP